MTFGTKVLENKSVVFIMESLLRDYRYVPGDDPEENSPHKPN